jgi:PAS domain S-box-containing protein
MLKCADAFLARPYDFKQLITLCDNILKQRSLLDVEDRLSRRTLELRESEQRYHSLFSEMLSGFALHEILCDPQGYPIDYRFLDINPTFERFIGLAHKEIVGKTATQLWPSIDPFWIETFGKVALRGEPACFERFSPEFSKYFEVIAYRPKKDQCAVIFNDITERKQTEKALRESEARIRAVIDSALDAVIGMDSQGLITDWNPRAEMMFGWARSEVIGNKLANIIVPLPYREPHNRGLKRLIESGHGPFINRQIEITALRRDGTEFPIELQVTPLQIGDKLFFNAFIADISSRKKAAETQRQLAAIVEHSTDSIISLDLNNRITGWNEGARQIYGYSAEDMIGKPVSILNSPLLHDEEAQLLEKIKTGERIESFETVRRRSDGRDIHISLTISPIKDATGKTIGASRIARDITERKRAEKALRESNERYRRITQTVTDYIYTVHLENGQPVRTTHSPACVAVTGYTSEEFTFQPLLWMHMVLVEDRKLVLQQFQRILSGEDIPPIEHRIQRKDGEVRWVRNTPVPHLDPHGKLLSYDGLVRDITERKLAEEALQSSEEQLRLTMEKVPIGILVRDPSGEYLRVNDALGKLLGYTKDYLLQLKPKDIFHPDDVDKTEGQFREMIQREENSSEIEARLIRKNGQTAQAHIRSGLVRDQTGKPLFIVQLIEDITLRKQSEEERVRSSRLDALGIFAGGIAHDLNNILMAITWNLDLAIREVTHSKTVSAYLEEARHAAFRASGLSRRFLTFSKGGAPVKKTVNLADVLAPSVDFALRGSNLRGNFQIHPDLTLVEIDVGQISQVIDNLIINAREACPTGGEIFVRADNVELTEQDSNELPPGRYVRIEVEDEGQGIPDTIIDKIFDPYFSTKDRGSGLGLATCYSIMKRHGGAIQVSSQANRGSIFTLLLPAAIGFSSSNTSTSVPVPLSGKGKILIIDDEPGIRKTLSQFLDSVGYQTECAESGNEGCVVFARAREELEPFDAVILDATIPGGLGGEAAFRALKKIDPLIKVILCSGYADNNLLNNWEELGFRGRFQKPFEASDLIKLLNKIIVETVSIQTFDYSFDSRD